MAHICTCIRHCRLASPRVNEPYAHRRCACDSRNYRRVIVEISTYRPMEVLHGVSMWGIIIEIAAPTNPPPPPSPPPPPPPPPRPMEVLHWKFMWGIIIKIIIWGGSYIVWYKVGNLALQLLSRVTMKLNFWLCIRRYTSTKEHFEYSYPLRLDIQ